jgi:hypothetical protein
MTVNADPEKTKLELARAAQGMRNPTVVTLHEGQAL